eukprot:CAMPEP_0185704454 /NCGR_PEP_ID=MMETSP1164-20130828/17180_1 /TAXON_ID=1104430 /ORGANISM="Chrysoreinhardia sp, Strain CCMP2950" /LENGTH=189 /DNA_ID=CAMNT_0028371811 /DNA_START=8 /DNA_END=577 /DNA_ORIENTATION=+
MAWAFACSDWKKPEFFVALADASARWLDTMNDDELSQLHLVSLHFRLAWPELRFPLSHCLRKFQSAYQSEEFKPSRFQRDVAAALDRLGWTHVYEHVTAEGLSLDMAHAATKRAVEADGPSHFVKTPVSRTFVENGATQFKTRLLRGLGWEIIRVPFFEWERLGTPGEKEADLRARGVSTTKWPRRTPT